ncbi:MAG: hypothetical protein ABIN23_07930 [candidate division WOR-3 bacterium]|nr:hypothetical protein [Candidatus Omnitrophota bacterium]
MKKLFISTLIITAFILGCKKKETTEPPLPPLPPTPPSSSPHVPKPKFSPSITIIDTSKSPNNADQYVTMAANISNSTIGILNNMDDSLSFDFKNPPLGPMQTFGVEDRFVFTWDTLGLQFKLVIVKNQGAIIETLYVNGTPQGRSFTLKNYILVDLAFNYNIVGSDTFGDGTFNFYMNRDTLDTSWDNSDPCYNLFYNFFVSGDSVYCLIAIDTLHLKGKPHDPDFIIWELFGAKKSTFVHAGISFYNYWFLFHVKDYFDNSIWDEVDYVYNPDYGPPPIKMKIGFPHNPYEVISKINRIIKTSKSMIKRFKPMYDYTGFNYGLRFEINPQYSTSADTANVFWDGGQDQNYPLYPDGPFTVPPFDVGISW